MRLPRLLPLLLVLPFASSCASSGPLQGEGSDAGVDCEIWIGRSPDHGMAFRVEGTGDGGDQGSLTVKLSAKGRAYELLGEVVAPGSRAPRVLHVSADHKVSFDRSTEIKQVTFQPCCLGGGHGTAMFVTPTDQDSEFVFHVHHNGKHAEIACVEKTDQE